MGLWTRIFEKIHLFLFGKTLILEKFLKENDINYLSHTDIATGKCRLQCIEASDFIRPFTGSRLTTCPHRVFTNTMSTIYEPSRIPLRLDLRSDEARPSVEWGKVGRVIFTAPGAPLNQSALGPHRCHRIRSPWPCCFWSQTSRARLRVARAVSLRLIPAIERTLDGSLDSTALLLRRQHRTQAILDVLILALSGGEADYSDARHE